MDVSDFDFELPEALIALRPARPRRAARLLDATGEGFTDRHVSDLPDLLRPGDLLIFNDTRVIPARLFGERRRAAGETARVEALLIERAGDDLWRALARPGKRLRAGDAIRFSDSLSARLEAKGEGGEVSLRFDRSGPDLDAAIAACGVMPLPPYIAGKRPADAADAEDYQTLFAARPGAVAAPTAALHFDPPLMEALAARGVETTRLTLHVGAGTFLPVKTERIIEHKMHAEWGDLPESAVEAMRAARARGGRVVAVGTTALRLLETAARDHGGEMRPWRGLTDIFITPGWRFHGADLLMTNFHLPRSTLFMLVSAFAGTERMKAAYAHAIAGGYRFYSYGDSSLLRLTPSLR